MKTLFFISALVFFLPRMSQPGQGTFTLTGDVGAVKQKIKKIRYAYELDGNKVVDSVMVVNNRYIISGKINETSMLMMDAVYEDNSIKYDYLRDYSTVFILPGARAMVTHGELFSAAEVSGSKAHDEIMKLQPQLRKGMRNVLLQYVQDNPGSPVAVWALNQYSGPFLDVATVEPLYALLSEENKKSWSGRDLLNRLDIVKRTAIGNDAMDVQQKDSSGNTIALSQLKGKYVLLEFWASWCAPCRKENPNIVKSYNKYRNRGFEIFGVSVDTDRKKWLAAIRADSLTWINTCSFLDMNGNTVARAYGIIGIPQNLLIDPSGKIIAKNLRDEGLDKKLAEILGN